MAVAASANALVSAAEAEAYFGLGTLAGDDLDNLQRQINSASYLIENWLNTATIQRAFTQFETGGVKRWFMQKYPIVSVASIQDPAANTIPSTDYYIEKDRGILVHFGRFWIAQTTQGQPCMWTVTYTAGWWSALANVPDDVKQAAYYIIAMLRDQTANGVGVSSVSVGALSVSYGPGSHNSQELDRAFMPAEAVPLLQFYRCNLVNV